MTSQQPLATVAILSIGEMGLGFASILLAHNFHVISNVSDRSTATKNRASSAGIECIDTDIELVRRADYILSIVPPRDAVETAKRVERAIQTGARTDSKAELYFLDLNAISPSTVQSISDSFTTNAPTLRFVDGGIIGAPPSPPQSSPTFNTASSPETWKRPGVPLSGPHTLSSPSGTYLAHVLNTRHISATIGSASGLKCCFAALSKGFTALALQSFTTASSLGVYDDLQHYLDEYNPSGGERARKSVVGCTHKAYRWVEEMRQIGDTIAVEGGWRSRAEVFRGIAGVYAELAEVVEREGRDGMRDAKGVVGVFGEQLHK